MGVEPDGDPQGTTTADERAAMVDTQLRRRGIADERVLSAMSAVPRERFVDPDSRRHAYDDAALPIASGQSISQPYMVARMTELLGVRPGDRILEIGTGSGYQAAVLATLGRGSLSIERHAGAGRGARARLDAAGLAGTSRCGSATAASGSATDAPFDGIVVTAAAPTCPRSCCDQLADGGRLVIPVGPRERQTLVVSTRHGNEWDRAGRRRVRLRPARGGGRLAARVGRYTRPAMTHVFVSPHPDDVALSCGGLIASLRELGQNVAILTVFSGEGARRSTLTAYQREALGFGSKALWPATEAFNRANLAADYPIDGDPDSRPPWAATDGAARGDPGGCRRRRQAVLAALALVSPRVDPQRAARRPAAGRRRCRPRARS